MISFDKNYRTLVIIGNGFDLSHGYNTKFSHFVNKTSDPALDYYREQCEDYGNIDSWFEFECSIEAITQKIYNDKFVNFDSYDEIQEKTCKLNEVFIRIHDLFIKYLITETESKPVNINDNIKNYLNDKAFAINFNYTKIAEAYTNNIFYIHGSLEENDIILGYDFRGEKSLNIPNQDLLGGEPCLATFDEMRWYKCFGREALEFRRFLRETNNPEYSKLVNAFELYQRYSTSPRGLDEELEKEIYKYDIIKQFVDKNSQKIVPLEIDYSKITALVIMGHGIEADRVLLHNIFSKCTELKNIVIFRRHGENENKFINRRTFLGNYCEDIQEEYYK